MGKSSIFGLLLIILGLLRPSIWVDAARSQSTDEAYATLLYGDEFLLGVRVLGKSIRDTKSKKDMVCLVSDGVSEYGKKLLETDGWIVETIPLLQNPNRVRPSRFWGVYTKLKIFNMTNYKKVVYLDADTIVVKSVEDLFKCGKFCANLKHSERLNSGVLVVEPSGRVFNDMMSKVKTLKSYTGGDQGFLNSYYVGFANAHLFEPDLSPEQLKSRPVPEMQRLSTLYNADVGLYMLANKWMVDEKELHVIHYTLGPLKPWDWWTAWLVKPVDVWQEIREALEESLPGTRGGRNPSDEFRVKLLFLLPFFTILFCYYRFIQGPDLFPSLCRSPFFEYLRYILYKLRLGGPLSYTVVSPSAVSSSQQLYNGMLSKIPATLGGISVAVCFMSAVTCLGASLLIVPRQVMPWTGLLLMYEWTFTLFFLLFGGYLRLVYQWGRRRAAVGFSLSDHEALDDDSSKGHQRQLSFCNASSWYYILGTAFLAIAVPSLPFLLGVTPLFLRLGLMVAGSLVLTCFMAYASEHLSIRSFLIGLQDREAARNRNLCFL